MSVEIDLAGRTAIVTGSGRGIGERIATRFAEAGADVVVAARTKSEIRDTVEQVEARGVTGLPVPTDLRDPDDVEALVDRTVDAFGVPEMLVNNAGANIAGPPLEHSVEDIDTMLDVNLRGLFLLSQRYGQVVRDRSLDGGRIVNISSLVANLGVSQMSLYGATKAGINGITRGLAAELAADGVTVNSVSPGLIRVGRIESIIEEAGDELFDMDRIPLGRLGRPDDIANACLFLASDLAPYVTGEELVVDGGVTFTAGLYK